MSTPTASSSIGTSTSDRPPLHSPNHPESSQSEKGKGTLTDWLHAELQKTVRHIQFLEATANLAWWWCTLLVVLSVAVAIDHWLWGLPTFARFAFWLTGIGLSLFWIVRRIAPLFVFRIHPLYAAKVVEDALPELKNRLISWWELKHEPQSAPRGVVAAVGRQAVAHLRPHDSSALLDTRPVMLSIGLALSLTVLVSLYSIVAPRSSWTTAERILFPWKTIAPPARVKIVQVQPGSAIIPQSLPCSVEVDVTGLLSDEKVFVRFTSADRQILEQRLELTPKVAGAKYEGRLTTDGRGVQQNVEYWIEAGDATAGPYSLTVNPLPQLSIDKIRLTYPAYTKIPPTEQTSDGSIEAVEGTRVELSANLTGEAQKSFIEFYNVTADNKPQRSLRSEPINLQANSAQAAFLLRLNSQRENPTLESYTLRAIDGNGISEPNPLFYSLRITGDFAPEIQLTAQNPAPIQVSSRGSATIQINALDPDFGLSQVELEVRKGNFVLENLSLLDDDEGFRDAWNKKFQIRLSKWRLQDGDKITLTAIAKDNRRQPGSDSREPNISRSNSLEVEIVEASKSTDSAPAEAPLSNDASPIEEVKEEKPSTKNPSNGEKEPANTSSGGKKSEPGNSGAGSASAGDSQQDSQNPQNNSGGSSSDQNASESSRPNPNKDMSEGGKNSDSASPSTPPSSSGANEEDQNSEGQNADSSKQDQENKGQGSKSNGSSGEPGEASNNTPPDHDGDIMERLQERVQKEQQNSQNPDSPSGKGPTEPNRPQRNTPAGEKENGSNNTNPASLPDSDRTPKTNKNQTPENGNGPSQGKNAQPENGSEPNNDSAMSDNPSESSPGKQGDSQDSKQNDSSTSPSGGRDSDAESQPKSNSTAKESQGEKESQSGQEANEPSDSPQGTNSKQDASNKEGQDSQGDNSNKNDGGPAQDPSKNKGASQDPTDSNDPKNGKEKTPSQSSDTKTPSAADGTMSPSDQANKENSSNDQGTPPQSGEPQPAEKESGNKSADEATEKDSNGNPADSKSSDSTGTPSTKPSANGEKSQDPNRKDSSPEDSKNNNDSPSDSATAKSLDGNNGKQMGQNPGQQPNSNSKPNAADGDRSGSVPGDNSKGVNSNEGSEAANLEYAKEATNLALDYLERQKDQPDPELLKEMNWTKEDLNRFLERWKKTLDSLDKNNRQREVAEQDLRSLGLRPPKSKASAVGGKEDQLRDLQDSGPRVTPPRALKNQFESVKKALQQRELSKPDAPKN